jgi:phage gpG-like protein
MGLGFRILLSLNRDDISPRITSLIARARRPRPVLLAMGNTFKSITVGNFNSAGAKYRPLPWPAKRDGSRCILQKSTTMCKAFHLEVTNVGATLSNPMIYAAIHQFGGDIYPKTKKVLRFRAGGKWWSKKHVRIPARPFFPVLDGKMTPAAEELIARAGERALAGQGE